METLNGLFCNKKEESEQEMQLVASFVFSAVAGVSSWHSCGKISKRWGKKQEEKLPRSSSRCLMLFGICRFLYKGCEGIAS